jgi:hypothetical protein
MQTIDHYGFDNQHIKATGDDLVAHNRLAPGSGLEAVMGQEAIGDESLDPPLGGPGTHPRQLAKAWQKINYLGQTN